MNKRALGLLIVISVGMLYAMDPAKGSSVRVVEKDARGYVEMVKPEDPLRPMEQTVSPWGPNPGDFVKWRVETEARTLSKALDERKRERRHGNVEVTKMSESEYRKWITQSEVAT